MLRAAQTQKPCQTHVNACFNVFLLVLGLQRVSEKSFFLLLYYSKSPENSKKEYYKKDFIQKIIQSFFIQFFIFAE